MSLDVFGYPILMAAFASDNHNAAVDMLIERGAVLGDVVLAYAGQPPKWSNGCCKQVLAKWLELHEPEVMVHPDQCVSLSDQWVLSTKPRSKWVDVFEEDAAMFQRIVSHDRIVSQLLWDQYSRGEYPEPPRDHPAVKAAEAKAKEAVRLDLKRRVLRLFPEVNVTRAVPVRQDDIDSLFRMPVTNRRMDDEAAHGGIRLEMKTKIEYDAELRAIWYRQTLSAPDWIAPDTSTARG